MSDLTFCLSETGIGAKDLAMRLMVVPVSMLQASLFLNIIPVGKAHLPEVLSEWGQLQEASGRLPHRVGYWCGADGKENYRRCKIGMQVRFFMNFDTSV